MSAPAARAAWLGALLCCALATEGVAGADDVDAVADAETAPRAGAARRGVHASATAGWYAALTGPLSHGPAAELEIHPGGFFGRLGAGLYYRGDERIRGGAVALGLAYEVGAARPKLTMGLHVDVGYDLTDDLPLVGAGVRSWLGVVGPLVVSGNATAHVFLDGIDSRLGLALTLSAGLAD